MAIEFLVKNIAILDSGGYYLSACERSCNQFHLNWCTLFSIVIFLTQNALLVELERLFGEIGF